MDRARSHRAEAQRASKLILALGGESELLVIILGTLRQVDATEKADRRKIAIHSAEMHIISIVRRRCFRNTTITQPPRVKGVRYTPLEKAVQIRMRRSSHIDQLSM